ncbi:UDP-N-acetylmuramate dehydrogenase [Suilimivivens aceti]|uniref:UDP-N-acetylenolpyruvoylglucosamine reductase n=1 Tax=Suilimivivens aceti TaxID=2981774 RepID=A0ABT2T5H5_9FIRM|nr:UDP-N-acetylmuramate dehydrogenase [Suilimivivens aceti]MCU6745475.1 UDP-N-acetylmuramate dehydrogenase [Suilimivivens aceti]SCI21345.1 UDP-N-acetylenolpyruvoylglucosamine reductase [uncultured Clostridium sp.]
MRGFGEAVYEYIRANVPEEDILTEEPMSRHTTFRIGGEAACFIRISSEEQLRKLIPYFENVGAEYFVLGKGSNLLVGDKGYPGVILQISDACQQIEAEENRLQVQAGAALSKVALFAMERGLEGLEFAAGIPGTVGGGVVMNAGAYGGEMKQVVESVRVLSSEGEILTLDNDTMEFGYRTSIIRNRNFIVLSVTFLLREGNREEIRARIEDFQKRRMEKQPLNYPSAGSTFKRPEGYFAGKLIMDAGLRGFQIGDARVSDKHCGFVVNVGKATARDVTDVIEEVQEKVRERFGVSLEREVIYLGKF